MNLSHETQDKGDEGVAMVIACFARASIKVALPLSEHLPFDLIAISPDGLMAKVSVKYRTAPAGKIEVLLRSKWKNANKSYQQRNWTADEVDCHAIYCPDTGKCYFVRDDEVTGSTITLRTQPPQRRHALMRVADNYTNPTRIF